MARIAGLFGRVEPRAAARGVGYVLAVSCAARVRINQGRTAIRADEAAFRLPASAWHRHVTLAMLAL
ncbi:hypothetical protein ACFY2X_47210, partial [Streptosporangium sp. NPDC000396]